MTRFTQQWQSGPLTVKTPKDTDSEPLGAVSRMILDLAKQHLETVQGHLNRPSDPVIKAAHRCFLTGPNIIPALELLTIRSVITKTWNGLTGDVTLKIADRLQTTKKYGGKVERVGGYVRKKPVPRLKNPQNIIIEEMTDSKFVETGTIHLDAKAIRAFPVSWLRDTNLNPALLHLLHEATHMYAGTADYCYFDHDTLRPKTQFDDMARAITNADSYALFVGLTGGAFNWETLPRV